MNEKDRDKFTTNETRRRFEPALRGAGEVGHKPMKNISPQRRKATPAKESPKHGRET
jgi:hypothetical protein